MDTMPNAGGSVYSSLSEAEAHAGAAIVRLKERDAREEVPLPARRFALEARRL